MRSLGFVLILGLVLAPTPALAEKRFLQGKLVFVDEQDKRTPAVGLEVVYEETGSSATTNADGLFKVPLPDILLPGDRIRLQVQGTDWRIWQPLAGEVAVPPKSKKTAVTLELREAGAKRFLSEAAIELLLSDAAGRSKEQVKPGGRLAEIQLSRYVGEWAVHYGFAPEDVKAELERWIAEVEGKHDDLRRLALAEFAKNNFGRASDLAAQWATSHDQPRRKAPKADIIQAYRLAGDAQYNAYRFEEALAFYRKALALSSRKESAASWAGLQDDLGMAARELGIRVEGGAARQYLDESIGAHWAALQARTRALPQLWAETQSHLALALQELGNRTPGEDGQAQLALAVQAYRAALEVYTRERTPQRWASIQTELAAALQEQGNRSADEAGRALLAQAVEAYRSALEVYTRAGAPQQWAMIQNRLGTALQDEAHHAPGEAGRALLAQAVQAYRSALEVYTRGGAPQQWAMIQNNLGTALEEQANRSPGEAGQALLAQAAQAYEAAAEVSTHSSPWNLQWHLDNAPSGF